MRLHLQVPTGLNFVCLLGSAVLIRALEPRVGMAKTSRPDAGCWIQSVFARDLGGGHRHWRSTCFRWVDRLSGWLQVEGSSAICLGTRIGISRAVEMPWRLRLQSYALSLEPASIKMLSQNS